MEDFVSAAIIVNANLVTMVTSAKKVTTRSDQSEHVNYVYDITYT